MTAPTQQKTQPLPDLAAFLVWQHQQDQENLASKTAYGLAALWPILRFAKLDETTATWLRAVTLQIETSFRASEKLSYQMASGVQLSWIPTADPVPFAEAAFPLLDVRTSMQVTGPIGVKRAMPAPETDVMAAGKVNSTGAGVKQAGNGGRGQVIDFAQRTAALQNTRSASQKQSGTTVGYARVTDGNPCSFCALLASQGAIYLSEDAFSTSNNKIRDAKGTARQERRAFVGDGIAKVHDHCKCTMRPVFSVSDKYDARARFFLDQWNNMDTSGLSPADQVKEFRKVYVPPEPYKVAPPVDLDAVRANREALSSSGFGDSSPQVEFYDSAIKKLA